MSFFWYCFRIHFSDWVISFCALFCDHFLAYFSSSRYIDGPEFRFSRRSEFPSKIYAESGHKWEFRFRKRPHFLNRNSHLNLWNAKIMDGNSEHHKIRNSWPSIYREREKTRYFSSFFAIFWQFSGIYTPWTRKLDEDPATLCDCSCLLCRRRGKERRRGPATTTRLPPSALGPARTTRAGCRRALRKFDEGIADRWDCENYKGGAWMMARDRNGNGPNGPDRYGRGHSFARHPLWSKFEVQILTFQNRPQILIAPFLKWYDIMRTSILAYRSVQNKSGQKSCSRCIFAVQKVSKIVIFWGTRKHAKLVIFWH